MLSPITGSDDTQKIGTLSSEAIAARWRKELGVEVGSQFESLSEIEHWRCNTTGFEWYAPAEAAGGGALYSQLQQFDWYYMPDKWEFLVALGAFGKADRILEIGIGFGHFLAAARRQGMQVAGVELNPTAAARAREAGFTVFENDLETLADRCAAGFDGVCAFQVLEHVPDPMPFLSGMLDMLRPGGRLVLSVPNAKVMRVVDPMGEDLLDQPPHHVTKWDADVFRSLEQYLPVDMVDVRREPLQAHHAGSFVHAIGGRIRRTLRDPFGRMLINRYTLLLVESLARSRIRLLIPGHTLLVVMRKRA